MGSAVRSPGDQTNPTGIEPARPPPGRVLRNLHRSPKLDFFSLPQDRSSFSMCRRVSKKLRWDRAAMRKVALLNEKLGNEELTLSSLAFMEIASRASALYEVRVHVKGYLSI